jgi:hypothetical protein
MEQRRSGSNKKAVVLTIVAVLGREQRQDGSEEKKDSAPSILRRHGHPTISPRLVTLSAETHRYKGFLIDSLSSKNNEEERRANGKCDSNLPEIRGIRRFTQFSSRD